jgi:hypothetical protein
MLSELLRERARVLRRTVFFTTGAVVIGTT